MGDLVEFEVARNKQCKGFVFLPSRCNWITLTDMIRLRLNIGNDVGIQEVSVIDKSTGDQLTSWSESKPISIPDMSTFRCLVFLNGDKSHSSLLSTCGDLNFQSHGDVPTIESQHPNEEKMASKSLYYIDHDENGVINGLTHSVRLNSTFSQTIDHTKNESNPIHSKNISKFVPFAEIVLNEVPSHKQLLQSSSSIFVNICMKGNTSAVESALNSSMSFVPQSDLIRGMIAACSHGHVTTAQALYDHEVAVDAICESDDVTPLQHAALRNHTQVCLWLLSVGASPLRMNSWGTCAIHYFCVNGMTDVLADVLGDSSFKMVDIRSLGGRTGLHFASGYGHVETVCSLLDHGADLNASDGHGNTPLHYACEMGMTAVVKILLKNRLELGISIDKANEKGSTPLLLACRAGQLEIARFLVHNGANAFAEDKRWQGCVHYASHSSNLPILRWLLKDIGHNPGSVDRDGLTPLDVALNIGHEETVEFLRTEIAECSPHVPARTPTLSMSTVPPTPKANPKVVQAQHQKANIRAQQEDDEDCESDDDFTLYQYQKAKENKASVLADNLRRSSQKQKYIDSLSSKKIGNVRQDFSLETESPDTAEKTNFVRPNTIAVPMPVSSSKGRDSETTSFLIACTSGDLKSVLIYLDKGLCVDVCNENGSQGIHSAAASGHLGVIKCLVDRGADINAMNNGGNTPLHFACQQCHVQVIKWIVSNGASVIVGNNYGMTPIHYLCFHGDTALSIFQWFVDTHIDMRYFMAFADADRRYLAAGWPPCTLLHCACEAEGSHLISAIIAAGVSVNDKNEMGQTALHIAGSRINLEAMQLLLEHPDGAAMINETDNEGKTALFDACLLANIKGVKYLVGNDADVKIRNLKGNTCLHVACQSGSVKLVKWLIDAGADLNAVNNDGYRPADFAKKVADEATLGYLQSIQAIDFEMVESIYNLCLNSDVPRLMEIRAIGYDILNAIVSNSPLTPESTTFHSVCHHGQLEVVRYLHETFSISLTQPDKSGCTPLHYAVIGGHLAMVLWIIGHGVWALEPTAGGRTSLHLAAKFGHLMIVDALIGKGVDIDCKSSNGTTPVFEACSAGLLDVVKYFVDNGAQRGVVDNNNRNLVHYACESGCVNIIEYLIDIGLDIDEIDNDGLTPLLYTCELGHLSICELLLSRGCSVYLKGGKMDSGDSAVHLAARHGHMHIVQWLVRCGVNGKRANSKGLTPAESAVFERHYELAEWLDDLEEDSSIVYSVLEPQLSWAISNNFIRLARGCLEEIINVLPDPRSFEREDGSTLLHSAASIGHHFIVDSLVNKRGCDVDKRSHDGWSAVHVACSKGHLDFVKALKADGAKMKARDVDGNTPLHVASDFGHLPIVQYFAKSFKNLDIANSNGWTALHYAASHGFEDICKALVGNGASGMVSAEGGITPLHLACHGRHVSLAYFLVKTKAADVSAKDSDGATASTLAREQNMTALADWLDRLANGEYIGDLVDPRTVTYEDTLSIQQQMACSSEELCSNHDLCSGMEKRDVQGVTTSSFFTCLSDTAAKNRLVEPHSFHSLASSNESLHSDMTRTTSTIEAYSHDEIVLNKSFIEAIEFGDIALANSLFVAGASPRFATPTSRNTALHTACMVGNIIAVKYLYDRGSDLNARNLGGLTPLHVACDREFGEIALYLLREGAPIGAVDKAGQTPLHIMTCRGMAEVIRVLPTLPSKMIRAEDVGLKTASFQTALHLAIACGHSDLLEDLLRLDIAIDGSDSDGQTPLHLACAMSNLSACLLLLAEGADPNRPDSSGKSPLYFACVAGKIKMVQALVDHNGIIECRTRSGDTLLHAACQHGRLVLAKWLVSCGLDPTQKNHQKRTPRDYAMESGNIAMMEWIGGLY